MITRKHRRKGAGGFSLTELLTVLGIIAVLSAIVFPVFFHVRENGRKTACASNLRQIGQAFFQYVSDYDGVFPGAIAGSINPNQRKIRGPVWTRGLFSYTNKTYLTCPDQELPSGFARPNRQGKRPSPSVLTAYAMNYAISEETPTGSSLANSVRITGRAESLFRYPSLSILVFDARTGIVAKNFPDFYPPPLSLELQQKWRNTVPSSWVLANYHAEIGAQRGGATRHNGGANYLLADGHVKWLRPEAVSASPTCDGINPGFGL